MSNGLPMKIFYPELPPKSIFSRNHTPASQTRLHSQTRVCSHTHQSSQTNLVGIQGRFELSTRALVNSSFQ
jgi:hypothetical protein